MATTPPHHSPIPYWPTGRKKSPPVHHRNMHRSNMETYRYRLISLCPKRVHAPITMAKRW